MNEKLWGGRFNKSMDELMEQFSQSIDVDKKLYEEDIRGSIAHTKMLLKVNIISEKDAEVIINGLLKIKQMIESGNFEFSTKDEDIHMNIERALIEILGKVGGKLHTARSRNDQIALDMRIFLREASLSIIDKLSNMTDSIVDIAKKYIDIVMPGFTHMQHAQPILFSHYMLSYYEAFKRDQERFTDTIKRIDIMPLGSGALAGTTFHVDRVFVAEQLKFSKISGNSIDAVSDRDFAIEFLNNCAILCMHSSRFAEDMIIFSTSEFNFVDLPDEFCTGSSIMPQKKNPDALELIRGKTARTYANLIGLLTLMKALPLSYNRDMQEDKKFLFDSKETTEMIVDVLGKIIANLKPNRESMGRVLERGFITATDLADYITKKGIPFREAHRITGEIILYCEKNNKILQELSLSEFKSFLDVIDDDVYDILHYKKSLELRKTLGGTATDRVLEAIKRIESYKENDKSKILCPRCSYPVKVYKNPIPTVDVIIEIDDKIILIRRKNEPFGWALPGGYVNYGETVEDAAIREAREETSIKDIKLIKLQGVYSSPNRDPRWHTITTVFVAEGSGIFKANDDAADIDVFDRYNLPETIVFDHKKIIEDFFNSKKNV